MRIIVCDAGLIINLHEAGILSLLKHVGEISLPHSVSMEVLSATDLADNWPEWLRVVQLSSSELWLSAKIFEEAQKALIDMTS